MKVKDLLTSRYSKFGTSFIITPNRELICFSDENDDLVTKFRFPMFIEKPILIELNEKIIGNERIESVLNEFTYTTTQTLTHEFLFNRRHLEPILDTIKLGDNTHLRFFSRNNSIFVRIFDYRNFTYEVSFNKDGYHETQIAGDFTGSEFSFTLEISSFLKLTKCNYQVEILENGIVGFISLDDESEFYFINQDISEPVVQFEHESLKKEVSLIFKP